MKLSGKQIADAYETYLVAYSRCAGNLPTDAAVIEQKFAAACAARDYKEGDMCDIEDFETRVRSYLNAPAPVKAAKPDVTPPEPAG